MFTESSSTPLFLVDSKSLRRFSLLFRRSGCPNLSRNVKIFVVK